MTKQITRRKQIVSPFYNIKNNKIMSTEAKTISMTLGERVKALEIFNAFKGSLVTMKSLLDDVKPIAISDEEWKEANLVKTPAKNASGEDVETWKWDELVKKDITLSPESVDYLKAKIKEKSDAGEITLADVALSTLEAKL